jgi:transposase
MQGKALIEDRDGDITIGGIDVCEGMLDVFLHPQGTKFRVRNDAGGIQTLLVGLAEQLPALVVMEATGRDHRAAWRALHAAGIPVAVVNPYRSRRFAKVIGRLAKTDKMDAEVIARFGAAMRPNPSVPPSTVMAQIAEIAVARRQLVAPRIALELQLSETLVEIMREQIDAHLSLL